VTPDHPHVAQQPRPLAISDKVSARSDKGASAKANG
jgi:hypothetical protein